MKEWNCDEFVVEDAASRPVDSPDAPASLRNSSDDKALYGLLQSAPVMQQTVSRGVAKNSSKEYNQGLLRYELTPEFDIDEWNCKVAGDATAKTMYNLRQGDKDCADERANSIEMQPPLHDGSIDGTNLTVPEEWRRILKEGLLNETRTRLKRKYDHISSRLFPDLPHDPSALPSGAASTTPSSRDDRLDYSENFATGLSAIVTALGDLRERQNSMTCERVDAVIESLNDAARIFSHLYHRHASAAVTTRGAIEEKSERNENRGKKARNVGRSTQQQRVRTESFHCPNDLDLGSKVIAKEATGTKDIACETKETDDYADGIQDEETTSQRVKRLLCGITDEEYRMKRKRDNVQDTFPGIVEILKQARALHGVHEELLLSWPCNAGAVKRYQKPIKLWWDYCQRESSNVYDVTVTRLKDFFAFITRDEPKTYDTLHVYKTAILLLTPEKLEKDRSFTEYLKKISCPERKTA